MKLCKNIIFMKIICILIITAIVYLKSNDVNKNIHKKTHAEYKKFSISNIIDLHFSICNKNTKTAFPVQIKSFSYIEKKLLNAFFDNLIDIAELLNHSTYFLMFSDENDILEMFAYKIPIIITKYKNTSVKSESLLPDKFEVDPILEEIIGIVYDDSINYSDTLYFNNIRTANERYLKIKAFVSWCSFYFYFSGTYSYPFSKNITEYLFIISQLKFDINEKVLILYEIGMMMKKVEITYQENKISQYKKVFPFSFIILKHSYLGNILITLSKYLANEFICHYELSNLMRFYLITKECKDELFYIYLECNDETGFFKNIIKKLYKFDITDSRILNIFESYYNESIFVNFFNQLILESINLSNIDDMMEIENKLLFIFRILTFKAIVCNRSIMLINTNNGVYQFLRSPSIDMINSHFGVNVLSYYNLDIYDEHKDVELKCLYKKLMKDVLLKNSAFMNDLMEKMFKERDKPSYKLTCYILVVLQLNVSFIDDNLFVNEDKKEWISLLLDNLDDKYLNINNINYENWLVELYNFHKIIRSKEECRIHIDETNIFIDSRNKIDNIVKDMISNVHELKNYTISYGNTFIFQKMSFKKWLLLLATEFMNSSNYLLKKSEEIEEIYEPCIFHNHSYNAKGRDDLIFLGRIIGLAISKESFLPITFNNIFYQILYKMEISIESLFSGYSKMKLEDVKSRCHNEKFYFVIECVGLELNDYCLFDYKLCPNGNKIRVTKENFEEYKSLYLEIIETAMVKAVSTIKMGIYDILDKKVFYSIGNLKILKAIISGNKDIDIKDWRNNTIHSGDFYEEEENTVKWFWEYVEDCQKTKNKLNELLMAITDSWNVPIGGFGTFVPKFRICVIASCSIFQVDKTYNILYLSRSESKELLFIELNYLISRSQRELYLV
ncbi:E3 ubiquitin-protein ligase HACE1 [Astathelohania contejeani]|uniref:HECT-type E3 ubiquitin transferase n=1 Tax=Astathelohania contejeani TaxID=164912 RepID=A0ABQ7I1E2_9MICR|nr:E3 ubiquitin-protein ligase HACE1 [Thelohania contejeani]